MQGRAPGFPPQLNSYKVVANLPYYITSPVLRHFLEAPVKPETMVVMVQKEVAEAIVAAAGTAQRAYASPCSFTASQASSLMCPPPPFSPPPEVDSAVVKIDVYRKPPVAVDNAEGFFKLVRAGFTAARKQVANSLAQGLGLPKAEVQAMLAKADIDPQRRAETFTLEEWAALWGVFSKL